VSACWTGTEPADDEAAVDAAADSVGTCDPATDPTWGEIADHVRRHAVAADPCLCQACAAYRHVRNDGAVQRAWQRIADACR
jgi:hypothetical protein